jgi:ferritin-like metal-binding protein YciE
MEEDFATGVKDAALISAAQRVEHYEIAAYGCAKAWAGLLGETDAQNLLEQTLLEEKETNEKLTELSEDINVEAMAEGQRDSESESLEEPDTTPTKGKSRSAKA